MSILLGREATGGTVARVGFEYQDAFALLHLPTWLAQDAFSGFVSELVGDIELTFLTCVGQRHIFIEAKNNVLSQPDFWKEIARFEEVRSVGGDVYEKFWYVAPNTPAALAPMRNILSRLRGVASLYSLDEPIMQTARQDFINWVTQHTAQSEARAKFVLDFVEFFDFDASAAEQRFVGAFTEALPVLEELSPKRIQSVESRWRDSINKSVTGHVTRRQVETELLDGLTDSEKDLWQRTPSNFVLQRGVLGEHAPRPLDFFLDLRSFVGPQRLSLTPADWNNLLRTTEMMGEFLLTSRSRRRVRLNAELRMSAAVLLGNAVKATRGHILEISHRQETYAMDDFSESQRGPYFRTVCAPGEKSEGLVCIQIGVVADADVESAKATLSWDTGPYLQLSSELALSGVEMLNRAVNEAKRAIGEFRASNRLNKLHLFVKGPSFFAMALGYRLNVLGNIQLYDWVDLRYIPTAELLT